MEEREDRLLQHMRAWLPAPAVSVSGDFLYLGRQGLLGTILTLRDPNASLEAQREHWPGLSSQRPQQQCLWPPGPWGRDHPSVAPMQGQDCLPASDLG